MRLELIVDSGNAAIVDAPDFEFARILRQAADKIEQGQQQFPIMDYNGNRVGECNTDYTM
jgi:hypothetical protein